MAVTEAYEAAGHSREEALRRMLGDYMERADDNTPVHTWDLPTIEPASGVDVTDVA